MKRNASIAFLFLVLTMFVAGAAFSQDDLVRGKNELQAGNIARAIELLEDFISDNETNSQGYIWLARAYMAQDSIQKAETELIKGRALAEPNPEIYTMLGDIYHAKKIYAAAEQQYSRATEFDSTNVGLFLKLADAQMKARQYNPVARTYARILELDPLNVTALRALGTLYVKAKKYTLALPILDKLYPLQPDSIDIQYSFVKTLFETRNYEKMIPIAENLFQKDASLADVQSMLGEAYKATKAFDRVVEIYSARQADSLSVDELVGLAKAYRSLDQFDKAVATYEAVLRRDSARCDILYDLGSTYMKVKDYQKAVGMFAKKIACDTSSGYRWASRYNAAMSYMQLKDFKSAEENALRSIELRPENVPSWLTLAQIYVQMANVAKQRSAYRKVIVFGTADTTVNGKYDKALEEAYRNEGFQELIEKKYPSAIDLLKKSIQLNPKHCNTLLLIAQAYHNSNNKDEATRYYCRVLSGCPKGEDAELAKKGLEILGTGCGANGR
ncbi:MAG TPA: tetratricopeptide repeat protein [Bacteroidota bacterium]|nr:tetratricopeptide repeat protein [Bacteroidota bacterium]